jgi:hypothetical protein
MRLPGSSPSTDATIIQTAIESLTSPRVTGGDDERTYTQRCGDALTEICNLALHSKDLPDHGGERPQVMLTMRLEDLRDEVGIGILEDGTPITATQARRFACDAGVIPAVLGGKSQPLDLGRTRRLYTGTVRRALILRDHGCAFPGCDRPAPMDGRPPYPVLAQRRRHQRGTALLSTPRRIHNTDREVRINPNDGLPEFIPPYSVDSERKPRRNHYHRKL